MRRIFELTAVVVIAWCCSHAQELGSIAQVQPHGWVKFENGMILSWQSMASDAGNSQVDVSDRNGNHLAGLNLLRLVPEAAKVEISDVSALRGLIAVAAAYISKQGSVKVRPASVLVVFDINGHVVSSLSVAPWRDALRIELDADSNIWALNSNADESKNAGQGSMLTEYSVKGVVLKELLPRTKFPTHADEVLGNGDIGFAAMGRNAGTIWFWLPGSTEFVTVETGAGAPSIVKTGLPSSNKPVQPVSFASDSSGALMAQFHQEGNPEPVYYRWSLSNKSWERFKPGVCEGGWLVGSDETEQIYIKAGKSQPPTVCAFSGH